MTPIRKKRKTMTEVYMEEMARKRGPLFEKIGDEESTEIRQVRPHKPYEKRTSHRNEQIIDLKYHNLTDAQIAQQLNLTPELVHTICYRVRLKTYRLGREVEAGIYRDHLAGKSEYEIAKSRHISGMAVHETIRIVRRAIDILRLRRAGLMLKEIVPHVDCNMRTVQVMIARWENKDEIADLL